MRERPYEAGDVTLKDVWRVVRESAEKRLGRELLWAYVVLLIVGVLVVVGCLSWGTAP